jgi:hypothetical protein
MQKIIVDTNVLVSSLIQRGYPSLIIAELYTSHKIELCLSEKLLQEYYEVLRRAKFNKYFDFVNRAEALLAFIETRATFFTPTITLNVIKDFADNWLLELAVESRAEYLITGNSNDFTFSEYEGTKIINTKEYWLNCIQ